MIKFLEKLKIGATARIRTWDPNIRSVVFYPAELRLHCTLYSIKFYIKFYLTVFHARKTFLPNLGSKIKDCVMASLDSVKTLWQVKTWPIFIGKSA